jgi:hypothetical protein
MYAGSELGVCASMHHSAALSGLAFCSSRLWGAACRVALPSNIRSRGGVGGFFLLYMCLHFS